MSGSVLFFGGPAEAGDLQPTSTNTTASGPGCAASGYSCEGLCALDSADRHHWPAADGHLQLHLHLQHRTDMGAASTEPAANQACQAGNAGSNSDSNGGTAGDRLQRQVEAADTFELLQGDLGAPSQPGLASCAPPSPPLSVAPRLAASPPLPSPLDTPALAAGSSPPNWWPRVLSFMGCIASSPLVQSALLLLEQAASQAELAPVAPAGMPAQPSLKWTLARLLALYLLAGFTEGE
jgi:hypothetical protein